MNSEKFAPKSRKPLKTINKVQVESFKAKSLKDSPLEEFAPKTMYARNKPN